MSILAMDISEMTSSKGIGIQICPFPISPFYDKPPFLPDPQIVSKIINVWYSDIRQSDVNCFEGDVNPWRKWIPLHGPLSRFYFQSAD
jgi:hypothetical protein